MAERVPGLPGDSMEDPFGFGQSRQDGLDMDLSALGLEDLDAFQNLEIGSLTQDYPVGVATGALPLQDSGVGTGSDMILPPRSKPLPLTQYDESQWEAVRPVITNLYIHQARPLITVIETMERDYHFKASMSMYKKRITKWGLRKNKSKKGDGKPQKPQAQQGTAGSTEGGSPGSSTGSMSSAPSEYAVARLAGPSTSSPRYLRQNETDEEMHVILDNIKPYIDESFNVCDVGPPDHGGTPRYIYDDFNLGISRAIAAFSNSDSVTGGKELHAAFGALEALFAERSPFVLPKIFYAVTELTSSNFLEIAQSLLNQAHRLALAHLPHAHPFCQVLMRFSLFLARDNDRLTHSVLTSWRACHSLMHTGSADSARLYLYRKHFWQDARNWPAQEQVADTLRTLLERTEPSLGHDHVIPIVILDELLAVYVQFRYPELEPAALDMLARVTRHIDGGTTSPEFSHWRRNALLELAWLCYNDGRIADAVEYLSQAVPGTAETTWEVQQRKVLSAWIKEAARRGPN